MLNELYPELVKGLVQDGITNYLDEQDKAPPSPKSTHGKVDSRKPGLEIKKDSKRDPIDQAFDAAKDDPEVQEAMRQLAEDIRKTS